MTDGTADGLADMWVGDWFKPEIGVNYRIPENAGNYMSLRGRTGKCIDTMQTGFGHTWAVLEFGGKLKQDDRVRPIRTCYLMRADGEATERVEVPPGVFNTIGMMERAWQGPSNSGTAEITGA